MRRRGSDGGGVGRAHLVWGLVAAGATLAAFPPHLALAAEPASIDGAPMPAAAPASSRAGVFVELRADDPKTRVYRNVPSPGVGDLICAVPCRKILDRDATYVIEGEGIPATSVFSLPDDADEVLLAVEAGSNTKKWIGAGLILVGGLSILGGFEGLISANHPMGRQRMTEGERDRQFEIAYLAIVGGVLVAVVGGALRLAGRTSVVSSSGVRFTQRRAPPGATPRIALTPHGLVF